jgi:hypothetical protein
VPYIGRFSRPCVSSAATDSGVTDLRRFTLLRILSVPKHPAAPLHFLPGG